MALIRGFAHLALLRESGDPMYGDSLILGSRAPLPLRRVVRRVGFLIAGVRDGSPLGQAWRDSAW